MKRFWVLLGVGSAALLRPLFALNTRGAVDTYTVATSKTTVNGVWRKVQAPLQVAAQFMVDEWDMLDDLAEFDVNWSAREITVPLDLSDDVGIASIPEGGYEARPASPNPTDATLTWILLNGRWTISKTARWIDQINRAAMLERQLLFQGQKKLQAMARRLAEYMYGFSTATMAKVVGDAAGVITLKDQYGIAGLGSTTAPFAVTNAFRVNDWVAVLNPSGPALRGISKITAVTPATPSITISPDIGTTAANDLIVFANSLENTTLAGGTDRDNGLTGFLDAVTSTSLHNVSGASFDKWNPGFTDTTGGRFTGPRLMKARQSCMNKGGGDGIDNILYDQGVERDVIAYLQAAVRFSDPYGMQLDGSPKAKGITFKSTRFVPEGFAFGFLKSKLNKMVLLPKPGTPSWDDAKPLIDQSGFIFAIDYPCQLVWKNRGNTAYWQSLSRQ
jgi:hypothetical protein